MKHPRFSRMNASFGMALLLSVFSSPVLGETVKAMPKDEISGLVRVVGSAYNAKIVLTDTAGQNQQELCQDDVAKRVGRLSGMTIKASGKWEFKDPKIHCFAVASFEIEMSSSGRKPLVGTLTKKDADFVLEAGDGKQHVLDKVSAGLKGLVGKKVIVDVKPLKGANGGESWKVVSYSEYP